MIGRNGVLVLGMLAMITVSGCAISPDTSYVGEFGQPVDGQAVATAMVDFVSMRLPGAPGVLVLDPTPSAQARTTLSPSFAAALRRCGFAIGDRTRPLAGSTHRVRYLVTPLDNGVLARLTIDRTTEGAQFFVRDLGGSLQAGGPFTVRQVEAMR
jgi:hypothetical protein